MDRTVSGCFFSAATARLMAMGHDMHLSIVGDGPLRPELEHLVRTHVLTDRVTLTGAIPDPAPFYDAADLVVSASHWEGLPYALLDGMAAGKPVVATRVGGVADLIEDGKDGLLVEPGDVVALAEAIVRTLSDEPLRKRLGAAARKKILERYTLKSMVQRTATLYTNGNR